MATYSAKDLDSIETGGGGDYSASGKHGTPHSNGSGCGTPATAVPAGWIPLQSPRSQHFYVDYRTTNRKGEPWEPDSKRVRVALGSHRSAGLDYHSREAC